MRPTLYLETTVPSYLTALPSRDIIVLAHQEITRQWWTTSLPRYEVFISQVVLEEARGGDLEAARKRLDHLLAFPVLEITEDVEELAAQYVQEMNFPPRAFRDALHLALASVHGMDYLVTWNCAHIARGDIKKSLHRINAKRGIETPTVCTPEELLEE